jgi:Leucine-rich repeat (LRR) protein
LCDLSLSQNQLTSIPQKLTLLALEKLRLHGNPLKADVLPIIQQLRDEGCEVVGTSYLEAKDDNIHAEPT